MQIKVDTVGAHGILAGMDKKGLPSRRGRPPLGEEIKQRLIDLYKGEGRERSLRWLGREVGISQTSVRRILEEAGLWKRRQKKAPEPADGRGKGEDFVSLAHVADVAGVSKATVSLSLNGSPKISEETRKRVQAAARKVGYRMHPYIGAHMASIRAGRVRSVKESIAYIYAGPGGESWKSFYEQPWGPRRKFDSAREIALRKGYHLREQSLFEYGPNARRMLDVLYNRGTLGFLLDVPAYFTTEAHFSLDRFSSVALRDQYPLQMHVVGHDMFRSVLKAFVSAWKSGYRRIGFLTGDAVSTSSLFVRDAAFRHAQYHLAPPEDHIPILHADTLAKHYRDHLYFGEKPEEINRCGEAEWLLQQDWSALKEKVNKAGPMMDIIQRAIFSRWVEEHQPDLIICENGDLLYWLGETGYSVPDDMGVIHLNLNADVPGWSGIRRADERIAEHAIDLLVSKINHGETGQPNYPIVQRIAGDWQNGTTTRHIAQPRTPYTRYAREWIAKVEGDGTSH